MSNDLGLRELPSVFTAKRLARVTRMTLVLRLLLKPRTITAASEFV